MGEQFNRTPTLLLARMQLAHLGEIAFRLQFVILIFLYASFIGFFASFLYIIFLIMVSMATLGIIYLACPWFASLWGAIDSVNRITEWVAGAWVILVPVEFVLSTVSIVALCFDKRRKHPVEIAFSVVTMLLSLFFVITMLNQGGK